MHGITWCEYGVNAYSKGLEAQSRVQHTDKVNPRALRAQQMVPCNHDHKSERRGGAMQAKQASKFPDSIYKPDVYGRCDESPHGYAPSRDKTSPCTFLAPGIARMLKENS